MSSKYESVKYTLQPSKYIDGELTAGAGFLQLTTQLLMYLSSASENIANKNKQIFILQVLNMGFTEVARSGCPTGILKIFPDLN